MKNLTTFLLILFSLTTAFAQSSTAVREGKQEATARKALDFIKAGKHAKALKLFNADYVPSLSVESLETFRKGLLDHNNGKDYELEVFKFGQAVTPEQTYDLVAFRFDNDVSETPGIIVIASFLHKETDKLVGLKTQVLSQELKTRKEGETVKTTRAEEEIIGEAQVWEIDGKTYKILGIELVFFPNDGAMMAIQVEMDFDQASMTDQKARAEMLPVAKYAYQNGWMEKARVAAGLKHQTLLSEIGVAMVIPVVNSGFRVRIFEEEYKD